jgi:hypothetical protein
MNHPIRHSFLHQTLAFVLLTGVLSAPAAESANPAGPTVPALLPQPKSLTPGTGSLTIKTGNRVVALSTELAPLTEILASDIGRMHGVKLDTGPPPSAAGDIGLRLVPAGAKLEGIDAYRISVDKGVIVEGRTYQAVAMGMMTVLQALQRDGDALRIARMAVMDSADRAFRGLQLSIRGGYHSPAWVKKGIDLMRFYKVRVLQLHTTEALWVGAVMDSSNGADPKLLREHAAWSKHEMEDVIAYAAVRGVSLVPHNEMRPNDPFWPPALTKDFNPTDKFADFVDEIDGKGKFEIKGNLADDPRWWNFLKVVSQRSRDQFAKGWPGGKLPYYHIGPVYGEGGCNGKEAIRMLGFLMENHPDLKMMYWNGPGAADPDLTPHRQHIVVDFYSKTWGGTPAGLLAAGYELCNTSWTPLYIQPGTFKKAIAQGKWIHDEFAVTRFGKESPFGLPIAANADDCSTDADQIIGSLLSTWDFSGERQGDGHLEMVLPCIPYYAEHAWNMKPWPYPAGAYEKAKAAYEVLFPRSLVLVANPVVPRPVGGVTATQGGLKDAVDVTWGESDNFPTSYQVFRADANDPAQATAISPEIPASLAMQLNKFRDSTATAGQKYCYWVKATNAYGVSELKASAEGFTGPGVAVPVSYEGFDYQADENLDTLNGGAGFKDAWAVKQANVPITITPAGLTYPGLLTTGKAAHFEILHDEQEQRPPTHTAVIRHLASAYGKPGTEVWTSFLIRPLKNTYSTTIAYNRIATGKLYGSYSIAGIPAEDGKTYLVVTRSNFQNGPDLLTTWVNPTPGEMPLDAAATTQTRQEENGESDLLTISVEAYIKGGNVIDEMRMGPTYQAVTPK